MTTSTFLIHMQMATLTILKRWRCLHHLHLKEVSITISFKMEVVIPISCKLVELAIAIFFKMM